MNNFVLGTANFFKDYGLLKTNVKKNEVFKILKYIKKKKYNYLDSSFEYDNFAKISKEINFKKFNISSKIFVKKKFINSKNFSKKINQLVKLKLKNLNIDNFDIFFIHNFDNLNILEIKKILREFTKLKNEKMIKRIGASVYNKNSINKIIKLDKIEVVQFPVSIIERKFLANDILRNLKKRNIKIQARSIFAQGLIFKKNYFKKIDSLINEADSLKLDILDLCLVFIKKIKFIDDVVIGVNNLKQLKQIDSSYRKTKLNMKRMSRIINNHSRSTFDLRKLNI